MFNANSGSGAPAAQYKVHGTALTLSSTKPTRTGYTFKEWNTKADGTGTSYAAGASYTANSAVTLYAIWTINNYTITYDYNYMDNDIYGNKPLTTNFSNATVTGTTSRADNSSAKYGTEMRYTVTKAGYGGAHMGPGRLTVGKTYTWSVYVKASKNITISLGQEQNGQKQVNLTTSWQRFTHTFTAGDTTYNSFIFYGSWAVGDVMYMHSLELKETPTLNITTQSKAYNTALGTLATPTRTGYTFQGWYTAPVGGTKISSTTKVPASNTTYYAQWKVNNYTITYNYNGKKNYIEPKASGITMTGFSGSTNKCFGVGTLYKDDLKVGDKLTVTFSASYSGLTAASGKTARLVLQGSGNTTEWSPGVNAGTQATWTGTGTATYTGTITITEALLTNTYFSLNIRTDYYSAGTITVNNIKAVRTTTESKSLPYGSPLGTLPSPSETGYTLNGWYTAKTGGTKISSTTTVPTANTTYYAQWGAKNYTVTYNYSTNGGTSATKTSATVASDALIDLTPTATKSGWTFVGWNTNKDATTKLTYLPMRTSNVTLYAIYSKTLTVEFCYRLGNTTERKVTIYNNATTGKITAPGELGTPSGWIFRHWGTTAAPNASKAISASGTISVSADTSYYASYQREITITFDQSGATNGVEIDPIKRTIYQSYGGNKTYTEVTLPDVQCASTSKYDDGWCTKDSNGNITATYPVGAVVSFKDDTTLYVNWKTKNYLNLSTNKYYETLNQAFSEAATVSEQSHPIGISVLRDVTETTTATLPANKRVTLVLNSHTITLNNVSIVNNGAYLATGSNYSDANLTTTQKSGTIKQTGTITAINVNNGTVAINSGTITSGGNVIYVASGKMLFIAGCTITGGNGGIYNEGGTVNINSGTVKATGSNGIFIPTGSGGTVNVTGGTIIGNDHGIWNGGSAVVNITGGTVTGTYNGISNYNGCTGTLNIGSKSSAVSTSTPIIQGKEKALYIASESKAYFYSGRIRGVDNIVVGNLNIRSGYKLYSTTQTVSGTTYKVNYLVASTSTKSLVAKSSLNLSTFSLTSPSLSSSLQSKSSTTESKSEYNNNETLDKPQSSSGGDDPPTSEELITEENVHNDELSETNKEDSNKNEINNEENLKEEDVYQKENLKIRLEATNNYNNEHSNTTTVWTDITENKNDGTITDGIWGENYLELNGETSVVEVPEINSEHKTIEVTFSVNKLPKTNNEYLIGSSSNEGTKIFISEDSYINVELYINGTYQTVTSTTKIEEGKVYDIAVTYDGNVVKLYINGIEEKSADITGTITNSEEKSIMLVGADYNKDKEEKELENFFNGKVYIVSIYNKALSDTEVHNNFSYNFNLIDQTTTNTENQLILSTTKDSSEEKSDLEKALEEEKKKEVIYAKTEEKRKEDGEEDEEDEEDEEKTGVEDEEKNGVKNEEKTKENEAENGDKN